MRLKTSGNCFKHAAYRLSPTTHFPNIRKLASLAHLVLVLSTRHVMTMGFHTYRVSGAQKTSTVARVKLFYVACSKNGFLSLDIDTE